MSKNQDEKGLIIQHALDAINSKEKYAISTNIVTLRKKSSLVTFPDYELEEDIKKLVYAAVQGALQPAAIAAPQVGIYKRITILFHPFFRILVNPFIVEKSKATLTEAEGCLSLGRKIFSIDRHIDIRVQANNIYGDEIEFFANGVEARVIQHELDHFDGVLVMDKGRVIFNV